MDKITKNSKIVYFVYARKSSESSDRQVQSIDDQVKKLKEYASDNGLTIKEVFTEAKSAKAPGNRPTFESMVERIENGEANGILCWQVNRLSRNPIDSAKVQWLLQQGTLKSIRTPDREYLPEDNVILFNVESGMANQFILELRKNTLRGLNSKLQKGWFPGAAPQGYLNDTGNKTIIPDPQRFPLVRRMWDLMLTGSYTPPKVLEIATDEWGYRTKKSKRKGGTKMALSEIYRLFTNIFYTGSFEYDGQIYSGSHTPMITMIEFERVQQLLGKKGKPQPIKHNFAYTGTLRCGYCGCMYTAETHTKKIKSTGEAKTYIYYHCTHKKRDVVCPNRSSIKEEELEDLINKEVDKYTILPEFRDWAIEILNENNDCEIVERTKIYEMQHKSLSETQKQLDVLTQMRYRDLINDEEYIEQKKKLVDVIDGLKLQLRQTEERAVDWLELTEKTFNFATYARINFIKGDLQTKKEILMALGQNPILKDKNLLINANKWLAPIAEGYKSIEEEYLRLEPEKILDKSMNNEVLSEIFVNWGG